MSKFLWNVLKISGGGQIPPWLRAWVDIKISGKALRKGLRGSKALPLRKVDVGLSG